MDPGCQELLRRFDHLSEQFHELREGVEKAVRIADDDPEMALTRARKVLELVVRDVYERHCNEPAGTRPLENLLQRLVKDGHLPRKEAAYANGIRELGNVGTHAFGERVTAADVYQSLTQLMPILEWYFAVERPEAFGQRPAPPAAEKPRDRPTPAPSRGLRTPGIFLKAQLGKLGCALSLGLTLCVMVALPLVYFSLGGGAQATVQPGGETEGPPLGLRVVSLDVTHFATVGKFAELRGLLGKKSFGTRLGDSVTVEARLSQPAYAYLVAFRADGTEEVCFPEDEGPPPLTDRPRYPSVSHGVNYGLDEGTGLEVFAVVASSQPLPPYQAWRKRLGPGPWQHFPAPPDIVWRDDGSEVAALTADPNDARAKGRSMAGATPVARLTDWLRQGPGVEAVAAVGFAVLPKGNE